MSGAAAPAETQAGILDKLRKTSAAEEFFTLLGVDYDPKVLDVARLHILRRMAQYLVNAELAGLSDAAVAEHCKSFLERAYADFVASSPIEQRVFKVLKDAVKPAKPTNLVRLAPLK
jgi:nitrogenase-stabilizing/protective protein